MLLPMATRKMNPTCSVLILLCFVTTSRLHALTAHAAWAAATKWRHQREVDVFLAVQAHKEGRNVADLLADTNVTLADKGARMVNGLGKSKFENLCLQAPC